MQSNQPINSTTNTFSGLDGTSSGFETRARSGNATESEDANRCSSDSSGYRSGFESASDRGSSYTKRISGSENPTDSEVLPSSDSKVNESASTLAMRPCDWTPTENASTVHQSGVELESQRCNTSNAPSLVMTIIPPSLLPIIRRLSRVIDEEVYPEMLREALAKRDAK